MIETIEREPKTNEPQDADQAPPQDGDDGNSALVVEFNPRTQEFKWAVSGVIPLSALVGTLELIQSIFLDQQKMDLAKQRMAEQQRKIVPAQGILRGH